MVVMGAEATPPTNVESAGPSAGPGTSGQDYAQQWAAAAAMQSYYGAAQQKQPQIPTTAHGGPQQAAAANAYYAQMAQHPNLYAQMWAGPVRPKSTHLCVSPLFDFRHLLLRVESTCASRFPRRRARASNRDPCHGFALFRSGLHPH